MTNEEKKKLACEFMMEGLEEDDAMCAAHALCIFRALRNRLSTREDHVPAAILTQAIMAGRRYGGI